MATETVFFILVMAAAGAGFLLAALIGYIWYDLYVEGSYSRTIRRGMEYIYRVRRVK